MERNAAQSRNLLATAALGFLLWQGVEAGPLTLLAAVPTAPNPVVSELPGNGSVAGGPYSGALSHTATREGVAAEVDLVLNEIYYAGSASEDWVEIRNTGSESVDVGGWWLCARFDYGQLNTMDLLHGDDYVLGPGELLVLQMWDLDNQGSDLGLYRDSDFFSTGSMVDFVQWGTAGNVGRSDVAARKGIWRQLSPGQFDAVPTAGPGQSTAWGGRDSGGDGLTHAGDWINGSPTPGVHADAERLYLPHLARP